MTNHHIPDPPIKFQPEYKWPEEPVERDCPKCGNPLQLNEKLPNYLGKPWWCGSCQWQFAEEELAA